MPVPRKTRPARALTAGLVGASLLMLGGALSASPPQRVVVTMANMKYGRIPAGLKAGDTIVWVNRDTVPHTVTARDRSFDLRVAPGQSVRQKLAKPGRFAVYCILHPAMRATLDVAAG